MSMDLPPLLRYVYFLSIGLISGCDDTSEFAFDNEGIVCLTSDEATLNVRVTFETCFSASCATTKTSNCSAVVSGEEITIDSHAVVENRGRDCNNDCMHLVRATCSIPMPSAGTYTVVHGAASSTIRLPLDSMQGVDESAWLRCN